MTLKAIVRPTDISIYEMEDGDIAIIAKGTNRWMEGELVQRYYSSLIKLGASGARGYSNFFHTRPPWGNEVRVKIIEKGETVEVIKSWEDSTPF